MRRPGEIAPAACTTDRPAPTALYDYAASRWVNGPAIPTIGGLQYDSTDGPGSILPDGNVLFDVSPCVYNAPIAFFRYNASSNALSPVPNVPNAANDSTFYTRLLALPNGQVLFNDGSRLVESVAFQPANHAKVVPTPLCGVGTRGLRAMRLDGQERAANARILAALEDSEV
jgi:hypothetical protein